MRFTVGMKIAFGFLTLLLVIVALMLVDAYSDRQVEDRLGRLYERGVIGSQQIGNASMRLQRLRGQSFRHIATADRAEARELEGLMQTIEGEFRTALRAYRDDLPQGDERRGRIESILQSFDAFVLIVDEQVIPVSNAADVTTALQVQDQVSAPRFDALMAAMADLEAAHIRESEAVYRHAVQTVEDTNRLKLIVGVGGMLLAALLAALITRDIASRLRDVSAMAARVSHGDLDARATVSGSDEISDVSAAFNEVTVHLADKLAEEQRVAQQQAAERARLTQAVRTYGQFIERVAQGELTARLEAPQDGDLGALGANLEAMGEALRSMTLRIHAAVGALSSATAEIGTTVQEHATCANETASAVAETAATVDEVQQSAERVTEHAQHVHEVSRRRVEVSAAGRQAVDHTVATMQDVRQQVDGIANRILSLSEQTQAVGQIIMSVNELAERSNLLALNAAIEAARAGEAGAGFGVVAQEIRALADQSKEATSHVRSILGDIQRSTTEAVLATEEGSKAVARAVDAVRGAGDRIEQLTGSIAEAARAAEHILTAAQQQAQGVGQISEAIHAIDAASRQTVSGTRIIEGASRDLNQLAGQLRDAVAQYRA